ncbi:hypothetical protein [Desulfitobacterium hafniense]|uniref:DUF2798 domain-containing protein n=1 Tax=Desulfitobacterium hafniense (strain Y51) TaxID=138119 RepID=Q24N40_DESHY|nr:hypothetical protein [Desulfitobacterium hafniense]BAE86552.1 hypothetical protein DSY4763 [Desulfitobacterium hafniense Y51]
MPLRFKLIMGFFMSFTVGAVMSIYMMLLNGAPLIPIPLLIMIGIATLIGCLVCWILPVIPLADKFAASFGAERGKPAWTVLQSLILATVLTIFVSCGMTAYATGFSTFPNGGPSFVMRWLSPIPSVFGIAYVATLLMMPLGAALASIGLKKPPVHPKTAGAPDSGHPGGIRSS